LIGLAASSRNARRPASPASSSNWARGPWATTEKNHTTWYQPLEDAADIDRAVHFALGLPDIFINTAGDLGLLPKVLDSARRFARRPPDDEMAAMVGAARMTSLFGLPT